LILLERKFEEIFRELEREALDEKMRASIRSRQTWRGKPLSSTKKISKCVG